MSSTISEEEYLRIYPRVVDCFPPLESFPGCKAPEMSAPIYYRPAVSVSQPREPLFVSIRTPDEPPEETPVEAQEIAIPSSMAPGTTQSDLPSIPPPIQYWRLKKIDHTANVMDYWIKSSQQWDIEGIESDIAVSQAAGA
jgi:hypothetical protein